MLQKKSFFSRKLQLIIADDKKRDVYFPYSVPIQVNTGHKPPHPKSRVKDVMYSHSCPDWQQLEGCVIMDTEKDGEKDRSRPQADTESVHLAVKNYFIIYTSF